MLTQGQYCETRKVMVRQKNVKLGTAVLTTWKRVLIQVGH
jgi:hypothetical protein